MLAEKRIFQVGFFGFPSILVAADDVATAIEMGEEWSLGVPVPGVAERKIVQVKYLGSSIIYEK